MITDAQLAKGYQQAEEQLKKRKPTGAELDRERMLEITKRMRSWQDLSQEIKGRLPSAIIGAVMSGRPELVAMTDVNDVSPDQTLTLVRLCAVLLETNQALQVHAEELAKKVHMMEENLKGLITLTRRIDSFANFKSATEGEDND